MQFEFDPRELGDNLRDDAARTRFKDRVLALLNRSGKFVETDVLFGAIVGMLLLDGANDERASGFETAFWNARGEADGQTLNTAGLAKKRRGADPDPAKDFTDNSVIYGKVGDKIATLHKARGGTVYYQQLADVSRKLLANAEEIPSDDPTFGTQIRIYIDQYVSDGPDASVGLDLPDLTSTTSGAGPDDLRRANIEAVAVIFAAYALEQARVFDTVDRIMETWWNGQLPVGVGRGSQALDKLYWNSEFRLTPVARHMQYGRVLGVPGGEVSTEVQPNVEFMDLFQRFVANLAEYDRQRRVGDIIGTQRRNALALTAEQVRQSGRNLAASASLYGWGGTQFAAQRIADHVKKAFEVLKTPEIQAAYGVVGPWQVVERVSQELGGVPNLVRWRAVADAGKSMLDIVARYTHVWSGGLGRPLFADDATSVDALNRIADAINGFGAAAGGGAAPVIVAAPAVAVAAPPAAGAATSDISDADRDELIRQAGNYIAVNGMQDDAVERLSQPTETQYAPSIPTLGGMPTAATNGGAGIDQLRQMVSQGQVPSLDELKNLIQASA